MARFTVTKPRDIADRVLAMSRIEREQLATKLIDKLMADDDDELMDRVDP